MHVVVPFAAERPKTRLSDVLSVEERYSFARAMLNDVLDVVRVAGHDPTVLATAPLDEAPTDPGPSSDVDVPVTVDPEPLSSAVNAALVAADEPVAVVMSDLALATPESVRRLTTPPEDVVVAPGRGGGTNALVVRHPDFRVDYHGASYLDHLRVARRVSASVHEVDSFRLATDVDEADDLAEVLLHGSGEACDWLQDAGFALDVSDGRVGVRRD